MGFYFFPLKNFFFLLLDNLITDLPPWTCMSLTLASADLWNIQRFLGLSTLYDYSHQILFPLQFFYCITVIWLG